VDILSTDPVNLQHPSWCSMADTCTAPDRLAERGQTDADVPRYRMGSHFGTAHVIPTSRVAEVEIRLEPFRDVYEEVTEQPDGVLLTYFAEYCAHGGTLNLAGEQLAPLATAFASLRDLFDTDRNPVVDRVAEALRVLGCITAGNADALLSLCVVHLTRRERDAVLAQFPAAVEVDLSPSAEETMREADRNLAEALGALVDAAGRLERARGLSDDQLRQRAVLLEGIATATDAIARSRS
jgi:hypothetical protein